MKLCSISETLFAHVGTLSVLHNNILVMKGRKFFF